MDTLSHISVVRTKDSSLMILVPAEYTAAFIQLVKRGANTWDLAPPELKTAVDEIIHGRPLQNYFSSGITRHASKYSKLADTSDDIDAN